MIKSSFYTPERRQPGPDKLRLPLTLKYKEDGIGIVATPHIQNNRCILEGPGRSLICLDNETFSPKWKTSEGEWSDRPVSCNSLLFIKYHKTAEIVIINIETGERIRIEERLGVLDQVAINGRMFFFRIMRSDKQHTYKIICKECDSYETVWEFGIANTFAANAFSADHANVIIKSDENEIICLNAHNGEINWQLGPLDTGLFLDQRELELMENDIPEKGLYNLKRTTGYPTIFEDKIITPMFGNRLVALDLTTGKVLWVVQSEQTHNFTRQSYGHEIYTMGKGYIEAWDMRSGKQTRSVKINVGDYADKVTAGAWNFTVSETHIYAVVPNVFYAVNKETGLVEWAYEPGKEIREDDQPYIANGRIYFRTLGGLYVFEGADGYLPPEAA